MQHWCRQYILSILVHWIIAAIRPGIKVDMCAEIFFEKFAGMNPHKNSLYRFYEQGTAPCQNIEWQ